MLVSGAALAGQDDIILEVTGNITEGTVRLDREALQKLPQASLETSTVVTDGTHRFTAVRTLHAEVANAVGDGFERRR